MNSGAPPRTGPALFAQTYQSGEKGLSTDGYRQNSGLLDCVYLSTATRGPVDSYTQSQLSGFWIACACRQLWACCRQTRIVYRQVKDICRQIKAICRQLLTVLYFWVLEAWSLSTGDCWLSTGEKGLSTDGYRQNSGLLDCVYLSTATRGPVDSYTQSQLSGFWIACACRQLWACCRQVAVELLEVLCKSVLKALIIKLITQYMFNIKWNSLIEVLTVVYKLNKRNEMKGLQFKLV
ncbi:hypothetical protein Taro_046244 [Colocasia esculenta]|uniref:Uncharacterized protein n=1 Tax=Colocasia esculenta TaxID=4460 RepID=A0A843WTA5_COLES|nr:hypothetical protein [Colocasia esculenta]